LAAVGDAASREPDVTYNFDPEKWLENERLRLDRRRRDGKLTADEAAAALEDIERRYEAMVARLDGTFTVGNRDIPKS
jgi:hypothetical protein